MTKDENCGGGLSLWVGVVEDNDNGIVNLDLPSNSEFLNLFF